MQERIFTKNFPKQSSSRRNLPAKSEFSLAISTSTDSHTLRCKVFENLSKLVTTGWFYHSAYSKTFIVESSFDRSENRLAEDPPAYELAILTRTRRSSATRSPIQGCTIRSAVARATPWKFQSFRCLNMEWKSSERRPVSCSDMAAVRWTPL